MPLIPRIWLSVFLMLLLMTASFSLGIFIAKGDMAREKLNYEELLENIASKDRELSVKDNELLARERKISALESQITEQNNALQRLEKDIIMARNRLTTIQKEYNNVLQTVSQTK